MFSRRLDPIPSWACLLQVFALDAAKAPSRFLSLVTLMATLSSHCLHRPSAIRHRAWLASLEAAYLLEVSYLPAMLSCPNISGEVRRSASPVARFRLFLPAVHNWIAGLRRAPLRRFETRIGAPSVLPPAVLPLVRLAAFQSVVCARLVGFIGSPLPLCPRRFRRSLRFLPSAVPRLVA